MRIMGRRQGQSTAEYAVLFAIVVGAAIAMQQYVKSRLQGAVKGYTDSYVTAARGSGATAMTVEPFDPARTTDSSSGADIKFTSASQGKMTSTSGNTSTITKEGAGTGGGGTTTGGGTPN